MIVIVAVLVSAIVPQTQAQPTLRPVLKRVLTIGADEDASLDALFNRPNAVVTDRQGRIYVADQGDFQIKVFDERGRFIRVIGSEGEGPGEFKGIRHIAIDSDGSLLVLDYQNQRIARFAPDGRLTETITNIPRIAGYTWRFGAVPGGGYLTLGTASDAGAETPLFTELAPDFKTQRSSFGAASSVLFSEDEYVLRGIIQVGLFWFGQAGKLWHTPLLYEGNFSRFERQGGVWVRTATLKGFAARSRAYERVDPDELQSDPRWKDMNRSVSYNSGRDPIGAVYYSTSHGVFVRPDGRVVHVSSQYMDDAYRLIVERFSPDGTFEGYGIVPSIKGIDGPTNPGAREWWMDDQGRFYILDQRGTPVVHVVTMTFEGR